MSSNVISPATETSLPPTIVSSPSAFLRLPVELRKAIYSYLIPNTTISSWSYKRPALRQDGGPCYPAILQLNRMIHEEVLEEWYGNVFYTLSIVRAGVGFLDRTIPPQDTMPSTLGAIRSLKISIYLYPLRDSPRKDNLNQLDSIAAVAKSLSSGKCSLKRLHLSLTTGVPFFAGLNCLREAPLPEKVRQALESNLHTFRGIRGLSEVRMEITNPMSGDRMWHPSEAFKAELVAISRGFLDILASEMSTPL